MKILVKSLVKNNRLTKISNGNNIFRVINSKTILNPTDKEIILDVQNIQFISSGVFLKIRNLMQASLNGNYIVKLENSNPFINLSFNKTFK